LKRALCNYALCAEHFSADPVTRIKIVGRSAIVNSIARGGVSWMVMQLIVTVALALYTPLMKNAFMIVSCHPFFQCEFPKCWREVDSVFGVTAYCAFLAIVVVGLMFPAMLVALLLQRQRALDDVFNHSSYKGRFLQADLQFHTPEDTIAAAERSWSRRVVRRLDRAPDPTVRDFASACETAPGEGPGATREPFSDVVAVQCASPIDAASSPLSPGATETVDALANQAVCRQSRLVNGVFVPHTTWDRRQQRQRAKELRVADEAWAEFQQVDMSLLFSMYETLTKECMAFAPIIVVLKFVTVLPAVLLEPNSFGQLLAILIGTALYGAFLEVSDPYSNTWIALVEEVGLCHQLAMVALQGYFFSLKNDENVLDRLGTGMIILTVLYFVVVFFLVLFMIIAPTLTTVISSVIQALSFRKYALNNFEEVPVYYKPTKGAIHRRTRAADEVSEVSSCCSPSDSDGEETEEKHAPLTTKGMYSQDELRRLTEQALQRAMREEENEPLFNFDPDHRATSATEPVFVIRDERRRQRIERRQRRRLQAAEGVPADARPARAPRFPPVRPSLFTRVLATVVSAGNSNRTQPRD
jgi:ABC-type multidrug transport system fused ATPase/permease subunit